MTETPGPPTMRVRQFLLEKFTDGDLESFCKDNFRDVANQFGSDMAKGRKIDLLIDYCLGYSAWPRLMALLQAARPGVFDSAMQAAVISPLNAGSDAFRQPVAASTTLPPIDATTLPGMPPALYGLLTSQYVTQLVQGYQPRRGMKDLFDIITEPSKVPAALFRADTHNALMAYQVPYVNGREGVADLQADLTRALARAGGRLLVRGRSGIGKTREVAEFARDLCQRNWTICIAREEGNAILDALATFPDNLSNARLLLIFDNLHLRTAEHTERQAPYADRLNALIAYLRERVAPNDLRIIAIAPSEPQFQKQLGFNQARPPWNRFGVYDLPEFSKAGLKQMLIALAAQANVAIDPAAADAMIENSDRKPETLFANVARASRNKQSLDMDHWLPNEGETWQNSFLLAQADYPYADKVYQALHLLRTADLPNRIGYVAHISRALAQAETTEAIEGLVDMGLLGMRQGVLEVFSKEQLADSLQEAGEPLPDIGQHWDDVIAALENVAERPPAWNDDLTTLALSLNRADAYTRSEQVAEFAIQHGADGGLVYVARGLARNMRGDFQGVEGDLSAAIDRGQEDARILFIRGVIRNLLGNPAGTVEDMNRVIAGGRTDADVYMMRGWAQFSQGKLREAETDFGIVITGDPENGMACYLRGCARYSLEDFKGADEDLTIAIQQGANLQVLDTLPALSQGHWDQVAQAAQAVQGHAAHASSTYDSIMYAARGWARIRIANWQGAESDLTFAIDHGFHSVLERYDSVLQQIQLPGLANAKEHLSKALQQMPNDALLYYGRGLARGAQSKSAEAEADFDIAIERGGQDADILFTRGLTRTDLRKYTEAIADYDAVRALGREDAEIYFRRAVAECGLGQYEQAEADFGTAIARGMTDDAIYLMRASLYFEMGRYADAVHDSTTLLDRGGADPNALFVRGVARLAMRELGLAEEDLNAAIERGRDDAPAHSARALVRIDLGKAAEAVPDLDAAIARGRDDAEVYWFRGLAHYDLADYAAAETDMSAAIQRGMADANVFFKRGLARLNQCKLAEAQADFETDLSQDPRNVELLFYHGVTRYYQGDWAGAEADYDLADSTGTQDVRIYQARADSDLRLDKLVQAEQDCTRAGELAPNDPNSHGAWGSLQLARRQYDEAISRFQDASQPDTGSTWHLSIGLAQLLAGRLDQASAEYRTGIAGATPLDILGAQLDLDFWTTHQADRIASPEAQRCAAALRDILRA